MKTATGRGVFNIFIASSFIVSSGNIFYSYSMCGAFALCGISMLVIGCCCGGKYQMEDLSKKDAASKAVKSTAKGAAKAGSYAVDNAHLIDEAWSILTY